MVGAVRVVCLALLTGAATLARAESRELPGRSPASAVERRRLASGVVVVALGVVVAQTIPLATQMKIRASQQALKRGDAVGALSEARDARTFQGWAASPHLQIALVQESRGRLRSAREEIRTAIERDRSDWRLWAVAARIQEESGSVAEARRSYEMAKSSEPQVAAVQAEADAHDGITPRGVRWAIRPQRASPGRTFV